jgi:3',5'-cyclic AMP phosphodiesterase CpdA
LKLATFLALLAFATAQARPVEQALIISDIHFNPLADPGLVSQLAAAEPEQWETILASDPHSPVQNYGEDTTWRLLAALVSGMKDIQPRPKVIILTGDVLPHKFQNNFAAIMHEKDPAALRSFAKKTFAFVSLELQKASGGIPVIYTLGNNDEECGDYALQPNGPFLQDTQEAVQKMAQVSGNAMAQWSATGSYAVKNPLARHHVILALNSNFWSRRYLNTCGAKTDADPGKTTLDWLAGQLKDAEQHGDKVWLAYHIPPGIDGHSSSKAKQTVPFWKPEYADAFYKLLDEYRKTIEVNLAGHTHLDDVRLVKTEHAETLVLINPAVSPNVGQNPAYRLMTVDSKARPVDLMTYYISNLDGMKWELEYSTRPAYGLKKIDAADYGSLYSTMGAAGGMSDKWELYYSVSHLAGLSDSSKGYLRALYCAEGNFAPSAYESCVGGSGR